MSSNATSQEMIQKFNQLNQAAEKLKQRGAKVEAQIEEAKRSYEREASLCREKYGTDNIEDLEIEIERRKQMNITNLKAFYEEIQKVEAYISEAERILTSDSI